MLAVYGGQYCALMLISYFTWNIDLTHGKVPLSYCVELGIEGKGKCSGTGTALWEKVLESFVMGKALVMGDTTSALEANSSLQQEHIVFWPHFLGCSNCTACCQQLL